MIYRLSLVKEGKLLLGRGIPPLLQVCKQMREETLKIYYAENSFGMLALELHFCPFYSWLEDQEPSIPKHLQRLTFYLVGFAGWSPAHKLLKVKEETLNHNIQLDFGGQSDMVQAFQNAFDLVSMLRKTGLSWEQLADVSKYTSEIMYAIKPRDLWEGVCWDDEFVYEMLDDFELSAARLFNERLAYIVPI